MWRPIWHDFFYTELTTGLRLGEICGLLWADFDERSGILKINRTLHREKSGRMVAEDTKTYAGTRKIVLSPSTVELLRARKKASFSPWIFHDPLCPEAPVGSAYRQLKKLMAQARLPSIHFHDLRHTFSTVSLEYGLDIKTLSTIIGHVSSNTTLNVYARSEEKCEKLLADMIAEMKAEIAAQKERLKATPKAGYQRSMAHRGRPHGPFFLSVAGYVVKTNKKSAGQQQRRWPADFFY